MSEDEENYVYFPKSYGRTSSASSVYSHKRCNSVDLENRRTISSGTESYFSLYRNNSRATPPGSPISLNKGTYEPRYPRSIIDLDKVTEESENFQSKLCESSKYRDYRVSFNFAPKQEVQEEHKKPRVFQDFEDNDTSKGKEYFDTPCSFMARAKTHLWMKGKLRKISQESLESFSLEDSTYEDDSKSITLEEFLRNHSSVTSQKYNSGFLDNSPDTLILPRTRADRIEPCPSINSNLVYKSRGPSKSILVKALKRLRKDWGRKRARSKAQKFT